MGQGAAGRARRDCERDVERERQVNGMGHPPCSVVPGGVDECNRIFHHLGQKPGKKARKPIGIAGGA